MDDEGLEGFVGVDWATEAHEVCVCAPDGTVRGQRTVRHSAPELAAMCDWLCNVTGVAPGAIGVAIEVPHGPVVELLLERGFRVYALNPKQLDRFRDRFTLAGAKDDRRDAQVLASSLRTDRACFRCLRIEEPVVIQLREWSRMTADLQGERVRLTNRLREQLRRYYPQALEVTDDAGASWFLDLWDLIPTPAHAAAVRAPRVVALLQRHRIRRVDAPTVLARLRAPALTVAPGTIEAATAHVRVVAAQLRLLNQQLAQCHTQLDALCTALAGSEDELGQTREQRDGAILRSLPGVGRIVLATLLAEASQPLRARDYHGLRALSGAAPVTRRSGKRGVVVMRQACHPRLREAVYHWSRVAAQRDPDSRAAYAALRARGHSHGRALRTIGDRLLCVACAMLRDQTVYDPSRRRKAA
jgi:transposase